MCLIRINFQQLQNHRFQTPADLSLVTWFDFGFRFLSCLLLVIKSSNFSKRSTVRPQKIEHLQRLECVLAGTDKSLFVLESVDVRRLAEQ